MSIDSEKYKKLISYLYIHYGNDDGLDDLIDDIVSESDKLFNQIKPLLENKNTCPKCNGELVPEFYIGYYDSFSHWICKCNSVDEFFTKNTNRGSYV